MLKHGSGVVISTTAKRVQSTATAALGCAWSGELRLPTRTELVPIYALEAASYPADEAASEEGMKFRLAHAPIFFRAFYCTEAPHAPASAVQRSAFMVALTLSACLPCRLTRVFVCNCHLGPHSNSSRSVARVHQRYFGDGRGDTPLRPAATCCADLGSHLACTEVTLSF